MYYFHICINGDIAGTTEWQTAPFVPRLSDTIKIDEIRYRVIEVEVEYAARGTEIFVYIQRY